MVCERIIDVKARYYGVKKQYSLEGVGVIRGIYSDRTRLVEDYLTESLAMIDGNSFDADRFVAYMDSDQVVSASRWRSIETSEFPNGILNARRDILGRKYVDAPKFSKFRH